MHEINQSYGFSLFKHGYGSFLFRLVALCRLLRANFYGYVSSFTICWICLFIYLFIIIMDRNTNSLAGYYLQFFITELLVPSSSNIITIVFMKRYLFIYLSLNADGSVFGFGIDVSPNSDCLLSHDSDLPCHRHRWSDMLYHFLILSLSDIWYVWFSN